MKKILFITMLLVGFAGFCSSLAAGCASGNFLWSHFFCVGVDEDSTWSCTDGQCWIRIGNCRGSYSVSVGDC